jgi:hypothetical protein
LQREAEEMPPSPPLWLLALLCAPHAVSLGALLLAPARHGVVVGGGGGEALLARGGALPAPLAAAQCVALCAWLWTLRGDAPPPLLLGAGVAPPPSDTLLAATAALLVGATLGIRALLLHLDPPNAGGVPAVESREHPPPRAPARVGAHTPPPTSSACAPLPEGAAEQYSLLALALATLLLLAALPLPPGAAAALALCVALPLAGAAAQEGLTCRTGSPHVLNDGNADPFFDAAARPPGAAETLRLALMAPLAAARIATMFATLFLYGAPRHTHAQHAHMHARTCVASRSQLTWPACV